jgi:hypothetical protein
MVLTTLTIAVSKGTASSIERTRWLPPPHTSPVHQPTPFPTDPAQEGPQRCRGPVRCHLGAWGRFLRPRCAPCLRGTREARRQTGRPPRPTTDAGPRRREPHRRTDGGARDGWLVWHCAGEVTGYHGEADRRTAWVPCQSTTIALPGVDLVGQDRQRGVTQHLMRQGVAVHARIVARTGHIRRAELVLTPLVRVVSLIGRGAWKGLGIHGLQYWLR